MLIFSSVHWLFPPVSACWSPRASHRASSPYPEGKCCSHLWWWKSWATYLHQWSHPEVTERWFFLKLLLLHHFALSVSSFIKQQVLETEVYAAEFSFQNDLSMKRGFRKTLHKVCAAKTCICSWKVKCLVTIQTHYETEREHPIF